MKFVGDKIKKDGQIIDDSIIKVDSFVNHQIDIKFAKKICKTFASKFKNATKILTIESSGIAFAVLTSTFLKDIPVVFAKKTKSKSLDLNNIYKTKVKSFTKNTVYDVMINKNFLNKKDKILIVDDFLAEGSATKGLIEICEEVKAKVIGVCVIVSKKFQGGEDFLKSKNIKLISGISIKNIRNNKIVF